jgi:hypothetical protein
MERKVRETEKRRKRRVNITPLPPSEPHSKFNSFLPKNLLTPGGLSLIPLSTS